MSDGDLFRYAGIETVLAAEPANWKAAYMVICTRLYRNMPEGTVFNGEVFRLAALRGGIGEPHHPNVWGAMANQLIGPWLEEGLIIRWGVEKAISAKAHARRYPSYRKIV